MSEERREIEALRTESADPRHKPAEALKQIKAILEKPGTIGFPEGYVRSPGIIGRAEPTTVTVEADGSLRWRHTNTRAGRPSNDHPDSIAMRAAEDGYFRQILKVRRTARRVREKQEREALAATRNPTKVDAGVASGKARQELKRKICEALAVEPWRRYSTANTLAKRFGVTARYVREIKASL